MPSRIRSLVASASLAVAVPLASLALLEGALWLGGVEPLADDDRYAAAIRHRRCQFAEARRRCRPPDPSVDLPGRLVVALGGSSVVGYQAQGAEFPVVLQALLEDAYPGEYGVVNLARTCKDSIYVRDCAARAAAAKPEALVVYAGHNDYANWGLRDPARRIFLEEHAWIYSVEEAASGTRLFSALAGLVGNRRHGFAAAIPEIPEAQLERGGRIVLEKFTENVTAIARLAERHGIHVLLLTVVSNLHEFPYSADRWDSIPAPDSETPPRMRRWFEAFSQGAEAFRSGRYDAALEEFARARDLSSDGRAHGQLNERIRELARRLPGVHLVDVEHRLHQLGRVAGVGCNFFGDDAYCDQFHPNARTHALIAHAVFRKLEALRAAEVSRARAART